MAELAVRVKYLNQQRSAMLAFLRLTFPLWGVTAPIAAVIIFVGCYFASINTGLKAQEAQILLSSATIALAFAVGMLLLNWLSHDAVEIDKDGVRLPFSLFRRNSLVLWPDVKKIMVSGETEKDWHKREIAFITSHGTLPLTLSHIDAASAEKLVLAMEMWGSSTELDQSVQSLKNHITGNTEPQLRFTGMWEEELSRRFCPTSFVPLDPGRVMRNGTIKVVRHLALGGLSAVYLCQLEDRKLVVLKEAVVSDDAIESAQAKAREMLDREAALFA